MLAAAAVVAVAASTAVTVIHANAAEAPQRLALGAPGTSNFDPTDGIDDCYPVAQPVPFANPTNGTVTVSFQLLCEALMPTVRIWVQIIDYDHHNGDNINDHWDQWVTSSYAETNLPCESGGYVGAVYAETLDQAGVRREGWYSAEASVDCGGEGFPNV